MDCGGRGSWQETGREASLNCSSGNARAILIEVGMIIEVGQPWEEWGTITLAQHAALRSRMAARLPHVGERMASYFERLERLLVVAVEHKSEIHWG